MTGTRFQVLNLASLFDESRELIPFLYGLCNGGISLGNIFA